MYENCSASALYLHSNFRFSFLPLTDPFKHIKIKSIAILYFLQSLDNISGVVALFTQVILVLLTLF